MKSALALAVPFVAVLACGPTRATPPPAPNQQIVNRLTDDIWPAVSLYDNTWYLQSITNDHLVPGVR